MADDPWKPPDPNAPAPARPPVPPGYAPQPVQYGVNPYTAPLPQRGSIKRLVWILSTVGVLVLGGCGVAIYFFVQDVGKNADVVNGFLRSVRDQDFAAAYSQLCADVQDTLPEADFAQPLQSAADRGHGVRSYNITSVKTTSTNGITTRTAGGVVKFKDDASQFITFHVEKPHSGLCVAAGYQELE